MKVGIIGGLAGFLSLALSTVSVAQDDDYVHIQADLSGGMGLQEISDRAFENAEDYWEIAHGHVRDGHDHEPHGLGEHDGTDELLSAGEVVAEIYAHAGSHRQSADPRSLDIVQVTIAVVNSWPDCQDTFDAVRSAVNLVPGRADEIVANIAVKRDCNCSTGGIWVDRRVADRIRVEMRHHVLDVPLQCSCSQVAMYAGITGLPENLEFNEDLPEKAKLDLIAQMTEKVTAITDRTAAFQSKNDWECGCTNVNIAASMQGVAQDELREGIYDGLAEKFATEAADTGMVVDSFGIVGLYPMKYWGDDEIISHENSLRRKQEIYQGDYMILDPFHPATEYQAFGNNTYGGLGQHAHTSGYTPTDLFISEYVEGWNEEAMALPVAERRDEQRNRVVELYNGTDRTVDLGDDQYFLGIYAGPGVVKTTTTVESPPLLMRRTITLQSDVTFDFDKSDIRVETSDDLKQVIKVLNAADIISEVLVVGHTCNIGTDEYNQGLSERRANSVKDFLLDAGLEVEVIRAEGRGEAEPRVSNDTVANRSRNRRIELTFTTYDGSEIEATVTAADGDTPKRWDYTFLKAMPTDVVGETESEVIVNKMPSGEYVKGDMKPRQVIGLNGAIETGGTFVVVFNDSDEVLTEKADLVTGQLDFLPNETLLVRRLGGEMALNCRAQSYAYVINYPSIPIRILDDPTPPPPPEDDDVASPN